MSTDICANDSKKYGTCNDADNWETIRFVDVNTDGKQDLVFRSDSGMRVFVSTGGGFELFIESSFCKNENACDWDNYPYLQYPDVNGDGKVDLCYRGDKGVTCYLNNGQEWEWDKPISTNICANGSANYGVCNGGNNYDTIRFVDVNSDGRHDLVFRSDSGMRVFSSTGSGFEPFIETEFCKDGHLCDEDNYPYLQYPDINGDGKADLCYRGDTGIDCYINNGLTWDKKISTDICANSSAQYGTCNDANNQETIRFIDLNTDGKQDLIFRSDQGIRAFYSTGTSFYQVLESEFCKDGACNDGKRLSYIDANGDGIIDLVNREANGLQIYLSDYKQPALLTSIVNGQNVATNFTYKPLTDKTVYTKGTDAQYPQQDFIAPVYVVSKLTTDNGIGGQRSISYHYEGGKVDLNGRGFRGFSKVTQTDDTTGIQQINFYERDYRYISTKVKRNETRLPDGTLIAETDNTASLKDYGNGVHFSRIDKSVSKAYELDGSLVTTTITTNQFDDYGNPTQIVVDHGNGYTETTDNTYTNDTINWILGRLTQAIVSKKSPGQPAQTRASAFEYDPESGLLTKEVIEPNHATLELVKSYQHDAYGNIQISTISGADIKSRSHRTDYDDKGRYVITSENALGHKETKTYRMGNLESLKGPNGLTTRWEYDGFGRTTLETRADGTQTRTTYLLCDAACPANVKYFVRTETSGAAATLTYYDKLDREIRRQTTGFDGRAIYIDQQYNARGEVTQVSDPYFADDTPLWRINEYDAISRPVKEIAPGDRVSTTDYQGLTTVVTNALEQTNTRTVNVLGQLIESIDNLDNAITYIYDGFGNLIELRDPANNVTQMQYNIRGNKISMYDSDTGQTTYTYNALGELISQTDANAQTVTMAYDKLGRMVQRDEPEGTSEWTYDKEPKGIGKLAMVKDPNGYKEIYRYDNFGRLYETQTTLVGTTYFVSKSYDQYGRADTLTYPTGFAVQNHYNNYGYLDRVQHVSNNKLYWQAERMNARGQLEQLTLGNGFSTDKVYDQLTGRLQSIKTGNGTIQSLGFHFDQLGNLTERTNSNLSETFQYDDLNRLTETKVDQYSTSIQYDKLGNITYKSDVGDYTYGAKKPHAVASVNGVINTQYRYDANGNRISSSVNGQQIEYTSFNKPRRITQGDNLLEFQYDPTYRRYEQKVTRNGLLTTTNYIGGGIFEREVSQDWEKHTHYIFAGGESVAIYIDKNHGVKQETHYLHKDHLGSVETITNEQGDIVKQLSFDAWGKRRDPDTWGALTEEDLLALLDEDLTTERGFTGHEHLDEVQFIHMNGRVYDPVIGRFLSADPIVQAPTFSQSLNRYSYVMNNPLSLVDPSGFSWWSKKVTPAFKKYWKPVVAIAVGIVLGPVTFGTSSIIMSGAGFGFGSAFTGTLLYGGGIKDAFKAGLKGAVIGGVTAGLTYGVGELFKVGGMGAEMFGQAAGVAKIVAHGVVGGLSDVAQGGKFEHGFLAGAFSAAASPIINPKNIPNMTGRVVASAVVGGTAAELGGGKFANGAVTGAFVQLYNEELHNNDAFYRPDGAEYVVGRKGTIIPEGGKFGTFLEDRVANFHLMGKMHDPTVARLVDIGIPFHIANIPTMLPSYAAAVIYNNRDSMLQTNSYGENSIKIKIFEVRFKF